MPLFRSHVSSSSPSSHHNKPLPPKSSHTNSKPKPEPEPEPEPEPKPSLPTVTTDSRPSRFHEHLDPNSPSLSHLPSYNLQTSTHPFFTPPTPQHDQKALLHTKHLFKSKSKSKSPPLPKFLNFKPNPSPKRLRHEPFESQELRTTRLGLASKLQEQNAKTAAGKGGSEDEAGQDGGAGDCGNEEGRQ